MRPQPQALFWIVCSGKENSPITMHSSPNSAEEEAKRLAEADPGSTYFVLETVRAFVVPRAEAQSVGLIAPQEIPNDR